MNPQSMVRLHHLRSCYFKRVDDNDDDDDDVVYFYNG